MGDDMKYYTFNVEVGVPGETEVEARKKMAEVLYEGGDPMVFNPDDLELINIEDD